MGGCISIQSHGICGIFPFFTGENLRLKKKLIYRISWLVVGWVDPVLPDYIHLLIFKLLDPGCLFTVESLVTACDKYLLGEWINEWMSSFLQHEHLSKLLPTTDICLFQGCFGQLLDLSVVDDRTEGNLKCFRDFYSIFF